jgi:hypothetical protein
MIDHLENYDKLDTPNGKMFALRKQKEAIEAEMQALEASCVRCQCGYLIDKNDFNRKKQIYIPQESDQPVVEFCFCPACGKILFRR